ncbi:MAG: GntR family transcriptional regulator [Candidatus Thermoplasmatota archaeon]|nr:GntR family transcriptional regulator [Candidatus Thermoplasmatota archaeon]
MSDVQVGNRRTNSVSYGRTIGTGRNLGRSMKNNELLIAIDLASEVPIYRQIGNCIVGHIATGKLGEGDILPSSRRLSSLLGVNYHTVNKAYEILSRDGLIHQDRRKKITVSGRKLAGTKEMDSDWIRRQKLLLSEAVSNGFARDTIMDGIEKIMDSISQAGDNK